MDPDIDISKVYDSVVFPAILGDDPEDPIKNTLDLKFTCTQDGCLELNLENDPAFGALNSVTTQLTVVPQIGSSFFSFGI